MPKRYLVFLIGILVICLTYINASLPAVSGSVDKDGVEVDSESYSLVRKWGSEGTGDGQFLRPHDLDFDSSEKYLYVADRSNNRIQVFDKNGTFLFKWGSSGTDDGKFNVPYGVEVDAHGNVWVADRDNGRIQKFDKDGIFIFNFGSNGSKQGQFDSPRQVAVDENVKFLYVADSGNHRIQKFYTNGTFIMSWGSQGKSEGKFDLPVSVIIDGKGDIIVNDRENSRVQKFDSNGSLLLAFGSTGKKNGQFMGIEHMATDKFNNIYVNDPQHGDNSGDPRVQKFDTNGNFLTKWGSYGKGDGEFQDPEHLAIDSQGNVYVSDAENDNIQVFAPIKWTSNDNDTLSVSTETNRPISGNASLRVDIKPAATVEELTNSSWSVISTDFIPVNRSGYHDYGLDVSAKDVNQLHSKLYHYDSNKKEISSDFIFGGRDGTFKQGFDNTVLSPAAAKYMKLQMWVKPSVGKNASYLVDNIELGKNGTNLRDKQIAGDNVPSISDNVANLSVEPVFKGTNFLTTMAFLGPDEMVVLEKNTGKVQRILNGKISDTLFDVNVANEWERGLIGIATGKRDSINQDNDRISEYVFLFYTESKEDGDDDCPYPDYCKDDGTLLGNRLYRYELVDNLLVNPTLLIDIPSSPMPVHQGGKILVGPDNHVYLITGDGSFGNTSISDQRILNAKSSNAQNGSDPIGRGGILRITQDGKIEGQGILGDKYPLNSYYAYGIRSSFGMDFDPLTGNLWDTENGPIYGDEINIVKPGFNSGWNKVQGIWKNNVFVNGEVVQNPDNLEDFEGKGIYSSPEFTWYKPSVGPTALKFLNSDKIGKEYENDLFAGDYNNGNVYHFDLNENRTDLILDGPLKDKIADTSEELKDVLFAHGFGRITDIQVGPDGYLYILSNYETSGDYKQGTSAIHRIVPVRD